VAVQSLTANTLGKRLTRLREGLTTIQANIVAAMDYPEEVDEPDRAELIDQLQAIDQEAGAYTAQAQRFRLMRDGFRIALLGKPNAGKSSLFNALLNQERSIVTAIAGTTRDIVTERFTLAGVPVTLVDTAGIRETLEPVERLGVERARQQVSQADAVLILYDVQDPENNDAELLSTSDVPTLHLWSKIDTLSPEARAMLQADFPDYLGVSVLNGQGIPNLLNWLEQRIQEGLGANTSATHQAEVCLNQRQLDCLANMRGHIEQAMHTIRQTAFPLDLVTIPITDALRELDKLLGIDSTEEMLDDVFSRFCVGK
jgi:tRNA modification GTPase